MSWFLILQALNIAFYVYELTLWHHHHNQRAEQPRSHRCRVDGNDDMNERQHKHNSLTCGFRNHKMKTPNKRATIAEWENPFAGKTYDTSRPFFHATSKYFSYTFWLAAVSRAFRGFPFAKMSLTPSLHIHFIHSASILYSREH